MKTTISLKTTLAIALAAVAISGCQVPAPKGQRTAALDDAAWSASKWISVAECPVVTGGINDEANGRAADGFVFCPRYFCKYLITEVKFLST